MPVLRCHTTERGEEVLVTVVGEVDLDNADQLGIVLAGALLPAPPRLIIDAAEWVFCDSAGVRVLLAAAVAAGRDGIQLAVINAHGVVYRVLDILGLLDALHVTPPPPAHAAVAHSGPIPRQSPLPLPDDHSGAHG